MFVGCGPLTMTHSYSPNFESNVPFCSDRSLSVKRGPSSCSPTLSAFLNIYLRARSMGAPIQWCGGGGSQQTGLGLDQQHFFASEHAVSGIG